MKGYIYFGFLFCLLSCKKAKELDLSKLDRSYFLGEYKTDFNNEEEIITLKDNGYYDYQKASILLKNQGKWSLSLILKTPQVDLYNYPNYFDETKFYLYSENDSFITLPLELVYSGLFELGNLEGYIVDSVAGEQDLIFEKVDKSKNKNYIKK
jgi:hypothetical protein